MFFSDLRVNEGIGSRNSLAELMVRFGQKSRVNPDLEKDSWTPSCNVTVNILPHVKLK